MPPIKTMMTVEGNSYRPLLFPENISEPDNQREREGGGDEDRAPRRGSPISG